MEKTETQETQWSLALAPDPKGVSRLHLRFRLQGLPGFVNAEGTQPPGNDGRKIYGHIPILVFGFNPARGLWVKSGLDVPVVEMPSGPRHRPVLIGNVTFRIPGSDREDFFAAPLDIWVSAMDQRAHVEVAAYPYPNLPKK